MPAPTDAGHEVYATARALYDGLELDRPRIRLVGVRVEGGTACGESARQLELGARERGWRDADRAVDRAVDRFGTGAVASTLVSPTTPKCGGGRSRHARGYVGYRACRAILRPPLTC